MLRSTFVVLALSFFFAAYVNSAPPADAVPAKNAVKELVSKAYDALKKKQNEDGSFAPKFGPGVTALTAAALIRNGYVSDDPVVAKALKYLEGKVKPDGGIYDKGMNNYMTCVAVMTFKEANAGGKYDKVIEKAMNYVKGLQHGDDKDAGFGGVGYDAKSPPDLSNTQFFVEALLSAGAAKDDAAVQKAIKFVSKCQNLASEYNEQAFAKKATDEDKGGFVYDPNEKTAKDEKKTEAGGLRSEGGMTYSGLKSFLYAGVKKDDKRVVAAIEWVKKHYTLDNNPGMGTAGLYYYYHVFAKAMDALGDDVFEDAKNVKHPWKKELFEKLKSLQKDDGMWANDNKAFMESQPEISTVFAILSLSYCK